MQLRATVFRQSSTVPVLWYGDSIRASVCSNTRSLHRTVAICSARASSSTILISTGNVVRLPASLDCDLASYENHHSNRRRSGPLTCGKSTKFYLFSAVVDIQMSLLDPDQ
jgi:hypothetical protein